MKAIDLHIPDVGVGPSHDEYEARYERCKITDSRGDALDITVKKILENKARYDKVESEIGCPWWWVGIIHMRESNLNFNTWLANGDPLSGPTRNVPAGLKGPGSPPWDWHTCAIISLKQMGYEKESWDTLGKCLKLAEAYNGWGYITGAGRNTTPPNTSPYIWSCTDQYVRGKYVADGRFDPSVVDAQLGIVVVMKRLEERGVQLFPRKGAKPVPSDKVTWVEFYRGADTNAIVGMAGDKVVEIVRTKDKRILMETLARWSGANTFMVAPSGKPIPDGEPNPSPEPKPEPKPEPTPVPGIKIKPFIKVTKGAMRSDSLTTLKTDFFDPDAKIYGSISMISGVPTAQFFRSGKDSISGSLEPLPEGIYDVGPIEWAGAKDDYSASHGPAIGAHWNDLLPRFQTRRAFLGAHHDLGATGTAGCLATRGSLDLQKEWIRLLRLHDPQIMIVDYGLGTLPTTLMVEGTSAVSSDRREKEFMAEKWKKTESTEVNDVLNEAVDLIRSESERARAEIEYAFKNWRPMPVYPPVQESSEVEKAYYQHLADKEYEDDIYSEGELENE